MNLEPSDIQLSSQVSNSPLMTFLSLIVFLHLCGGGAQLFSFHFLPKWKCLNPRPLLNKSTGDKAQGISAPSLFLSSATPTSFPKALASLPEHKTSAGSGSGKTIKHLKTLWSTLGSSQQPRQQTAMRHMTSRSRLAGLPPPNATGSQRRDPEGRHQLERSMNPNCFPG